MVRKKSLRSDQNQEGGVSHVEHAARMSRVMVAREMRGPGDTEAAMRRIEARYGVPYSLQWSLRYRPPKDILVGAWLRLSAAYQAECERQERLWRTERESKEALNAVGRALDRAAAFMAGAKVRDEAGGGQD